MSFLRPDEEASRRQIENEKRKNKFLKSSALTAASIALPVAGKLASSTASRVLPFLNENIPVDLAIKGISKVSPKIGSFLKKGMEQGLDVQEGLNFVKENFMKEEKKNKPKSLIESFNPDLFNLIGEEIQKGIDPKSIVTRLKVEGMKKLVDDIEKKAGSTLEQMIIDEFGQGGQGQPSMQQQIPDQENQSQQQPGQGQQALMSILQKLQQARSGR